MNAALASINMQRVCLLFDVERATLAGVLVVSRGDSRGARVTSLASRSPGHLPRSALGIFGRGRLLHETQSRFYMRTMG
jgi:hypothetical protein